MTHEQIIKAALEEGFTTAAIIDTEKIIFDPIFRPFCAENLCGQYGANHSCPPDCGSPEAMEQKVLAYPLALVLQTKWEISDFGQTEKIRASKESHNDAMFRLIHKLRDAGHSGFMIGSSGCTLCQPCAKTEGRPCQHPDLQYSCMSAYCIFVKRLALDCGMDYDYKDGILPFFGLYIFN